MRQKLIKILKESKFLKELYLNLRKNDKDFIEAGYCVDMDGNCEPNNCRCSQEIKK